MRKIILALFLIMLMAETALAVEVKVRLVGRDIPKNLEPGLLKGVKLLVTNKLLKLSESHVIVTMDLETYIQGVVAGEMPALWPLEALKAQAVAARSYAMAQIKRRANQPYQLVSTTRDQVFNLDLVTSLNRDNEKWKTVKLAVKETEGQILQSRNGETLWAYFHSDCGGKTDEPNVIWFNDQRIGTSKDKSCPVRKAASWKISLEKSILTQVLGTKIQDDQSIKGLKVVSRTKSGRVKRIAVLLNDGEKLLLSGEEFRGLFGFEGIKSTMFRLLKKPYGWLVTGRGHGHGVGMYQWGAREHALKGLDYKEILKHYYPAAVLGDIQEKPIKTAQAVSLETLGQ